MKKWSGLALALILLLACALPANAQVVLVGSFGANAEMLSYTEGEQGGYSESLLVDDGVLITTGREAREEGRNDTIDAALASGYSDAYDILIVDMQPIAGYPAERVRFYQGSNEDTHIVDYVYIPTDDWVFFAEISVPADWRGDYAELVDVWVDSIDLFDDGLDAEAEPLDALGDLEAQPGPLTWSDLEPYVVLTEADDTVAELVELLAPTWFTWVTDEETGAVLLSFACEGGNFVIAPDSAEALAAEQGAEGASDLPDAVLESGCTFEQAQWQSAGFAVYPPRGLYVGDEMDWVVEAYTEGERVDISDAGLGYSEMISYTVASEDEEDLEAELTYFGADGKIACIQLSRYEGGEEE